MQDLRRCPASVKPTLAENSGEAYHISRMPQNHSPNHPYQPPHRSLGNKLKTMRQHRQESLGETSGAVEIEVEQLDRFERGAERPSEDILMLLISHFGMNDDEAAGIWQLAGYDNGSFPFGDEPEASDQNRRNGQSGQHQHVVMLAFDQRVLYTNGAEIVADDNGVVISFGQQDGNGQPYAVSRVGMSYEQAAKLIEAMQKTLIHRRYMSGPKQLPPAAQDEEQTDQTD